MAKALTTEEVIRRSREKFGPDMFDYSEVDYKPGERRIIITCTAAGHRRDQNVHEHLSSKGCHPCYHDTQKWTTEEIIERCHKTHGDNFDYSNVKYVNSKTEINVTCNLCANNFNVYPRFFIAGSGCVHCSHKKYTTETFIQASRELYGNQFIYDNTEYTGDKKEIQLTCLAMGHQYEQQVRVHLRGNGCPICKSSERELMIMEILDKNGVKYKREKRFDDCISDLGVKLRFDFYLLDTNELLEHDGQHHFKPIINWRNGESFERTKANDETKDKYCEDRGIRLVRIPFFEEDLEGRLRQEGFIP